MCDKNPDKLDHPHNVLGRILPDGTMWGGPEDMEVEDIQTIRRGLVLASTLVRNASHPIVPTIATKRILMADWQLFRNAVLGYGAEVSKPVGIFRRRYYPEIIRELRAITVAQAKQILALEAENNSKGKTLASLSNELTAAQTELELEKQRHKELHTTQAKRIRKLEEQLKHSKAEMNRRLRRAGNWRDDLMGGP